MYRIDLSLALNETYRQTDGPRGFIEKIQKERTVAQTLNYMVNLVKAGSIYSMWISGVMKTGGFHTPRFNAFRLLFASCATG